MIRTLFITLFVSPLVLLSNNDWIKKEAFAGGKRERGISFSVGGRGYAGFGQDTAELMHRDLWEYDPGVDSWTQKAMCPGAARRNASCFVIGTSAYVTCGVDNAISWMGNVLNDTWEYNVLTNTWVQRANCPIQTWGVYYGVGFAINGYGFVCTGKFAASNYTTQMWRFDPVSNSWLQRASFPGGTRYGACGFVIGGDAYIGTGADENAFTSDFWRYNAAANTWSSVASFPASARFTCSAASMGGKGYLVFGTDGGYKDNLYEYDPVANSWQERKPFEGGGRRNGFCFVIGNRLYAGCGKGYTGCRRDFWEWTPFAPLGMGEEAGDFPARIYPNPITDHGTLEFSLPAGEELFSVTIHDVSGKKMREFSSQEREMLIIERGDLPAGNYFATLVSTGGYRSTVKFIVK